MLPNCAQRQLTEKKERAELDAAKEELRQREAVQVPVTAGGYHCSRMAGSNLELPGELQVHESSHLLINFDNS